MSLATLEAELIACSDGARGAIWLIKRHLNDLGAIDQRPIYCDNQRAVQSGVLKAKTKS